MKILEKKYPIGTIPGQRTAGRYIDGTLYDNLKEPARAIIQDHSFLGVCFSSTLENGTGKSVFMQQIGEAWTGLMNELHGTNLEFNMNNIVFKPKDLIKRAFEVPRYSCIILDEWDDLNYWSELGMSLRSFFRKCRQLNLFILVIIPNFFQLPMNYAISRSLFAIDVKFENGFDRGYFSFYNFLTKKNLYIRGKKFQDYSVVQPNFKGRFLNGYAVDEKEYRAAKLRDMIDSDKELQQPTEQEIKVKLFKQLYVNLKVSVKTLSAAFGISSRTGTRWLSAEKEANEGGGVSDRDIKTPSNNILIPLRDNAGEEELQGADV